MGKQGDSATLALVDADSGRLLRALSLQGPTPAEQLEALLQLTPGTVRTLLEQAGALGVVSLDAGGRYRVEPAALEGVVRSNRSRLLGDAA